MRKIIVIAAVLLFVSLFSYWLKCQLDINLVKSFSLSEVLPVQPLQKKCAVAYASSFNPGMTLELQKPSDWQKIWMREKDAVSAEFKDGGRILVDSKSKQDWSLSHDRLVEAQAGDVFGFSVQVQNRAKDLTSALSVILYDQNKKVLKWHYARKWLSQTGTADLANEFVVPCGVSFIRFRLTGAGIGNSEFAEVRFYRKERLEFESAAFSLENGILRFEVDPQKAQMVVLDKRCGKSWQAKISFGIKNAEQKSKETLRLTLIDLETLKEFETAVTVLKDKPQIHFSMNVEQSAKFEGLVFPPTFAASDKALAVAPIAEGLLLDRAGWQEVCRGPFRYKGGWSMPFLGMIDKNAGWMEIIETPIDFEAVPLQGQETFFENKWLGQKGKFGYARSMRYVFFDSADYVAMAQHARGWAKDTGFLVSLKEKDKARGNNLGKLLGAANVWFWGGDRTQFVRELQKAGIKKCLFSTADRREDIEAAKKAGFLASRYDIYQDVWPLVYHEVTSRHEGWPEDLVLDERGEPVKGWVIKRGLKEYPGGVICSIPGLARARKNITQELKEKPYTAKFIDTTTSSPWRECYSPAHPTTRREDLKNKMQLLAVSSIEHGLVTGSEDGVAEAVPVCDYFEGMMSIGMARLPDSGRNVAKVAYMPPTENFLKYQVGAAYRIPLWELVFHDCAVATWYWGDSSNRVPEAWWRKDLFNILYGNMPLWAIRDWQHWKELKGRFVECYNNVCPVFEKVGGKEMLSHRFVTEDHEVQETVFEGGVRIVVNFGEREVGLSGPDYRLPARGFVVFEGGDVWKEGVCS